MTRLGAWGRSGRMTGIVVAVADDEVTLFDPGERQAAKVAPAEVTVLPAGTVTVRVEVDLPLPHGFADDSLQRWVAALLDPMLRERARAALGEADLDTGPALPEPRLVVTRPETGGALCLAGHRVPAPDATALACPTCGRQAAARPTSTGEAGV